MTTPRYSVRIEKDQLVFCCGHFISFDGHRCERLHGHNYRAAVEVAGPLGPDWYVVDFVALKARAKEITDEWDHHMLVATRNPVILVEQTGPAVRLRYKDREWLFPADDCILLPIENTTAELLAHHLAGRLLAALRDRHGYVPESLRVEVEEAPGTSATVELRP